MEEIIRAITNDVNWLKVNYSMQAVSEIMNVKDRIAINTFYLSEEMASAYHSKNMAEYAYKSSVNELQSSFNGPVSKAKIEAEIASKSLKLDYIEKDRIYKRLALIMEQTNAILNEMRQRISYLKTEKNGY